MNIIFNKYDKRLLFKLYRVYNIVKTIIKTHFNE